MLCACVCTFCSARLSGYTAESYSLFLSHCSDIHRFSILLPRSYKSPNKVQLWLLCIVILAWVLADKGRNNMRRRCHNSLIVPVSDESLTSSCRATIQRQSLNLVELLWGTLYLRQDTHTHTHTHTHMLCVL